MEAVRTTGVEAASVGWYAGEHLWVLADDEHAPALDAQGSQGPPDERGDGLVRVGRVDGVVVGHGGDVGARGSLGLFVAVVRLVKPPVERLARQPQQERGRTLCLVHHGRRDRERALETGVDREGRICGQIGCAHRPEELAAVARDRRGQGEVLSDGVSCPGQGVARGVAHRSSQSVKRIEAITRSRRRCRGRGEVCHPRVDVDADDLARPADDLGDQRRVVAT